MLNSDRNVSQIAFDLGFQYSQYFSRLFKKKVGVTPYAKAMVLPLFVVGIIPLLFGISGAISNQRSIQNYQEAWEQNQEDFILSEKERVEAFFCQFSVCSGS